MSRAAPPGADAEQALGPSDPSLLYLLGRLSLIEQRVRAAVDRRRAVDADPGDRFRGLYISDEQVDGLLDRPAGPLVPPEADEAVAHLREALETRADEAERAGSVVRLRSLARVFGLEPVDVDLLLVALAPDLDPRFERLYGYLHDDVSRRRASVGLAIELCGAATAPGGVTASTAGAPLRERLGPLAPLVAGRLLLVEDVDRPSLTRPLRVPDRVTAHLLGDDSPDPAIEALLASSVPVDVDEVEVVARGLAAGQSLVYVRERPGASGRSLGWTAMARLGRPAIALDLGRLSAGDDPVLLAAAASREARLRGAGLVVGPVEPLVERGAAAVRAFAEQPGPVILVGGRDWDPAWSREPPLIVDAPVPSRRPAARAVGRVAQRGRAGGLRPGRRHDRVPPHARADRPGRAGGAPRRDRREPPDDDHRRRGRRAGAERRRPRAAGAPDRADRRLGRPRAPGGRRGPAARADRPGAPPRPGHRRVAHGHQGRTRRRGDRAVRRRLRDRQDDVGGGRRPRPRRSTST